MLLLVLCKIPFIFILTVTTQTVIYWSSIDLVFMNLNITLLYICFRSNLSNNLPYPINPQRESAYSQGSSSNPRQLGTLERQGSLINITRMYGLRHGVCCVMVFYMFLCRSVRWFLYGLFCHGALKLNISTLFTIFFLWTSFQFILQFVSSKAY